jgi:hypothetical protein
MESGFSGSVECKDSAINFDVGIGDRFAALGRVYLGKIFLY